MSWWTPCTEGVKCPSAVTLGSPLQTPPTVIGNKTCGRLLSQKTGSVPAFAAGKGYTVTWVLAEPVQPPPCPVRMIVDVPVGVNVSGLPLPTDTPFAVHW